MANLAIRIKINTIQSKTVGLQAAAGYILENKCIMAMVIYPSSSDAEKSVEQTIIDTPMPREAITDALNYGKGKSLLRGLFIGLAIMIPLISGMVSMLYVFEKIYLDIPQLESNSIAQGFKSVMEGGRKND